MKNIKNITLLLSLVFLIIGCEQKVENPDLSHEYPRILTSSWPSGHLETLGSYELDLGQDLNIDLYYTPVAYSTCIWYIDGKEYARGKDFNYTATEVGQKHLKVIVATQYDTTYREALLNVRDPNAVIIISRLPEVKATASGSCSADEGPDKARDGIYDGTKWCDNGPHDKWLQYDFGKQYVVRKVLLDWENWDINDRYKIQTSADGINWKDAVVETTNKEDPKVYENLEWTGVRYIRFWVAQNDDDAIRLMEFEVHGSAK